MAQIIGQVYNPKYRPANGDKKSKFNFSLGHRRAFVEDQTKPNLFTPCVAYNLADLMNTHFGSEEHHGKWVLLNGHWEEFDWTPDPTNPDHAQYMQKVTLSLANLQAAGFQFAGQNPTGV